MADVVRLTEDIIVTNYLVISILDGLVISIGIFMFCLSFRGRDLVSGKLCVGHDVGAGGIFCAVNLTGNAVRIGLLHKQFLFILAQQIPIPVADGVVLVVCLAIDNHLLAIAQFYARLCVVSIAVRHHVQQLHLTM